jgi:hypothetical protein
MDLVLGGKTNPCYGKFHERQNKISIVDYICPINTFSPFKTIL